MKILQYTALLALGSLPIIACNHDNKTSGLLLQKTAAKISDVMLYKVPKQEEKPADTIASPGQESKTPSSQYNLSAKPDWEKKIIKTADLNIEVKDYNKFNDQLHKNVKQFGGYVAQEEQNQSAYQITNTVVIKVPVDQFDDAIALLISGNKQLIEKKISTDDVTSEIVDTKSRMEAKKQIKLRYLDLLKQAKNMSEILQVQDEINAIQEQIESATGRIGYLNHSAVFSTIHLTFFQIIDATANNEKEPSYFHKIKEAVGNGWKWAMNIFIGMINIWPLLILVFFSLLVYRKWKVAK